LNLISKIGLLKNIWIKGVFKIKDFFYKILRMFLIMLVNILKPIILFFFIVYITVINIIFNLKSFVLGYKLVILQEIRYKNLPFKVILNILLLLIGLYIINKGIKINKSESNTYYVFAGAILSLWATYTFDLLRKLNARKEILNILYMTLGSQYNILKSIYESLFIYFPYNDNLFRQDQTIIYISPINAEGSQEWMDERKAIRFVEYFAGLRDSGQLNSQFNEEKARQFITLLEKDLNLLEVLNANAINLSEFQDTKYLDFFNQTSNSISFLISYSAKYQNWNDPQIRESIILQINFLIYKLVYTIIKVQRLIPEYNKYIKHIATPPKLKRNINLSDIIRMNSK